MSQWFLNKIINTKFITSTKLTYALLTVRKSLQIVGSIHNTAESTMQDTVTCNSELSGHWATQYDLWIMLQQCMTHHVLLAWLGSVLTPTTDSLTHAQPRRASPLPPPSLHLILWTIHWRYTPLLLLHCSLHITRPTTQTVE